MSLIPYYPCHRLAKIKMIVCVYTSTYNDCQVRHSGYLADIKFGLIQRFDFNNEPPHLEVSISINPINSMVIFPYNII